MLKFTVTIYIGCSQLMFAATGPEWVLVNNDMWTLFPHANDISVEEKV